MPHYVHGTMKAFCIIWLYLTLVLSLGALAAYPLWQALNEIWMFEFERVAARAILLSWLATAVILFRVLTVNNKTSLGYALPARRFVHQLLVGYVLGLGMLLVSLILVILGVREAKAEWLTLLPVACEALIYGAVAGFIIGFIEETFFRGACFTALRRSSGVLGGATLCSLIFAAVHFLPVRDVIDGPIHWYSGFNVLLEGVQQLIHLGVIFDSFIALFIAGIFLCLVRHRTGNIAQTIGIHAGWVTTVRITRKTTRLNETSDWAWLVGNYDQVIGYLSASLLALLCLWLYRSARHINISSPC